MCRSTQPLHGILENRLFRWRRYAITTLLMIAATSLLQYTTLPVYGQYEDSDAGYIDSAVVTNRFRLRYDAGFDLNRPDRAEYFYASWAELSNHPHAIKDTNQILSAANNRGPLVGPESVDYQDISAYYELRCLDRLSFFGELPFRFVKLKGEIEGAEGEDDKGDFDILEENSPRSPQGFSDLQFGLKFAVWNESNFILTFQSRAFLPTGNPQHGLGTGHFSTENGLLMNQRLGESLTFMGQAKLWTPVGGGSNAGNIAIYGAGLGYNLFAQASQPERLGGRYLQITPLAEFVGWTVLNGFETIGSPIDADVVPNTAIRPDNGKPASKHHGVQNASGKTIVNAKLGFRTHFSPQDSVYIGWGHALTGSRWYQDFARIEYRRLF